MILWKRIVNSLRIPRPIKLKTTDRTEIKKIFFNYRLIFFLIAIYSYTVAYFVRDIIKVANISKGVENSLGSVAFYALLLTILTIVYGVSKFVMGSVSDRANIRYFFSVGLFVSAFANFLLFLYLSYFETSHNWFFLIAPVVLTAIMGWSQGMLAPCVYKIFSNWWASEERGTWVSVYNTAHNLGAGLLPWIFSFSAFLFETIYPLPAISGQIIPMILALIGVIVILIWLKDNPRSVGLPNIEEFKSGISIQQKSRSEEEKETEKITKWWTILKTCLMNRYIWVACIVNAVGYILRFVPTIWLFKYLVATKGMEEQSGKLAYSLFEWGAIPGTILLGWLSDRYLKYRGIFPLLAFVLMVPSLVYYTTTSYMSSKEINPLFVMIALFMYGFFIYTPLNFVNAIMVMDVVDRRHVGTATGLVGMFGYLGTALSTVIISVIAFFLHQKNLNPNQMDEGLMKAMFIELWLSLAVGIIFSWYAYVNWKRIKLEKEKATKFR